MLADLTGENATHAFCEKCRPALEGVAANRLVDQTRIVAPIHRQPNQHVIDLTVQRELAKLECIAELTPRRALVEHRAGRLPSALDETRLLELDP